MVKKINIPYVLAFFIVNLGHAQVEYYTQKNKELGLEHFQREIYRSCRIVKPRQEPVAREELDKLKALSSEIMDENFSRAFNESPKIKLHFERDLNNVVNDPLCQKPGNHCRAKILALSLYYYQKLRPDIPDCLGYVEQMESGPSYNNQCEIELKYRGRILQSVPDSYGIPGPSTYKKELIAIKNNAIRRLFNLSLHKDIENLHICEKHESGASFRYVLNSDDPGEVLVGVDPSAKSPVVAGCVEQEVTLLSEFLPIEFDQGRSTVGADQVKPLVNLIKEFKLNHPDDVITQVSVVSSSSKSPYYTSINGKRVIDPKSNDKNLSLAKERVSFIERGLSEFKKTNAGKIKFDLQASLAGPDFTPTDLNDRFVTKMTPGYPERIKALYDSHQKDYEKIALKQSSDELLDEEQYVNIFQAKFKPFLGFKVTIIGQKKDQLKCLTPQTSPRQKSSRASSQ